jgi:hypothetical protein
MQTHVWEILLICPLLNTLMPNHHFIILFLTISCLGCHVGCLRWKKIQILNLPPSFFLSSKLGPSNKLKNSENGTYFISCAIAVALMNGITKRTQVDLHYEYEGNNFLLAFLISLPKS